MNPEIKAAWVAALRSGTYEQGVEALYNNGKMCCLGVLCDLHAKATGEQWQAASRPREYSYSDCVLIPPNHVAQWAELPSVDPEVRDEDFELSSKPSLAELNDHGYSFLKLADLIEKQL